MKKENILKYLTNENVDFELFESVTSTNDLLKKEALNGVGEGKIIAALQQTNGRGRLGKSFVSNKGGMYLSILLRPREINFDTTIITCLAAVAVCKAIEEITLQNTAIKWVNDILIDNKKVCGILCESGICGNESFIIVGIGLNYFCDRFSDEIKEIAANVFKTSNTQKFELLTAKIIDNFFKIYNTRNFLEDYKKRSIALGKEIYLFKNNQMLSATVCDIDNKCRLTVKYPDGKTQTVSSGEISIKLKEL